MSAGGVFKILTNDGKADQMLMATQLLKDRICDIIDAREKAGLAETLPTLKDLEKTHILHFQSKFKPFVALGYEYQRVKAQAGSNSLGGSVTFSIPQFGDFLADMVLNLMLSSCSFAPAALPAAVPAPSTALNFYGTTTHAAPSSSTATIPNFVSAVFTLPDGVTTVQQFASGVTVDGLGGRTVVNSLVYKAYVNELGDALMPSAMRSDTIFYCEFPGERILPTVAFEVNGNPLDAYDYNSYTWYRKFQLCEDKKLSYYRNMGQEVAREVNADLTDVGVRRQLHVLNGFQTPQPVQPPLRLWIKLLFWFNLDHSQSLVSAAIPYGQRFININFAAATDILFRGPAAYLRAVLVTEVYVNSTNATTPTLAANTLTLPNASGLGNGDSVHRQVLHYPVNTGGVMSAPSITELSLYVNNIFTIPEVHDIYIERIGFSLIRVHRIQTASVTMAHSEILLSQFKFPIEFFYFGLRPDAQKSNPTDWHKFTQISYKAARNSSVCGADSLGNVVDNVDRVLYSTSTRTVDNVSVTAHGVALYNAFDSSFFNSYQTEVYSHGKLVAPRDEGALFVNFALHPYNMQPSGHINTSRAREFYLIFDSSVANSNNSCTLLVEGSALNFLLVF